MIQDYLHKSAWFVGLLLLQVLILNYVHIAGYATPFLYIYMIIKMDSETPRNGLMLLLLAVMNSTIEIMLYGYLLATFTAYMLDIIILTRYTGYTVTGHIKDILPYAAISAAMAAIVMLMPRLLDVNVYLMFSLQILAGAAFYFGTAMLLGSQIIKDIKELILKR